MWLQLCSSERKSAQKRGRFSTNTATNSADVVMFSLAVKKPSTTDMYWPEGPFCPLSTALHCGKSRKSSSKHSIQMDSVAPIPMFCRNTFILYLYWGSVCTCWERLSLKACGCITRLWSLSYCKSLWEWYLKVYKHVGWWHLLNGSVASDIRCLFMFSLSITMPEGRMTGSDMISLMIGSKNSSGASASSCSSSFRACSPKTNRSNSLDIIIIRWSCHPQDYTNVPAGDIY